MTISASTITCSELLYAGIIVVGVLIVLSGLSMWKPVQLHWLVTLFGDYPIARYVHFFCMAAISPSSSFSAARAAGAEEPARDDHRPLREEVMGRSVHS